MNKHMILGVLSIILITLGMQLDTIDITLVGIALNISNLLLLWNAKLKDNKEKIIILDANNVSVKSRKG